MDYWGYFNFAKEVVDYLLDWITFIIQVFWVYKKQIVGGVIVFYLLYKIIDLLVLWTSVDHLTATVNHKERVYYPKFFYSVYLVYTDKEVLCVKDTKAFLRFGASNRYSKIQIGKTYRFTVCGFRSRLTSGYRNILKYID